MCTSGTYCVTPPPAGATYFWSVTNGTIVGPNNGPCVTINWNNNAFPGVVTVTVSAGPNCPKVTKEIGVKPCDVPPPPCCTDVKFAAIANGWALGPGGSATFTPSLSVLAGMGNITKVVATIVTTDRTFNLPACGAPGPVNSYFLGAGFNPNFNATIPQVNGRLMVWTSIPPGGVSLAAAQNFPMTIQFPTPPFFKCADFLSFCIRFEFTDDKCKVCEITACYGPYKRGGFIWWDTHLGTGVVGSPLKTQPVISVRDSEGNVIMDAQGTVSLSIVPGTGTPGAELLGKTTVPLVNGTAAFQDIAISKAGAGYQLTAHLNDPDDPDLSAQSNAFNVSLAGQVPIYHITAPITIDGDLTPTEWDGAPVINLNQAIQDLLPGHWTGPADYSGQVKLKWDEENLYFAVFVADSVLSLPAKPNPDDLLGRDGLQFFLGLSDHQHSFGGESYSDDDWDVRLSMDPPAPGTPDPTPLIVGWGHSVAKPIIGNIRARIFSGGYGFEGALPWKQPEAWTFTAARDKVIGFDLQGRDNDQQVPATDTLMSLTGLPGAETMPNRWTTAILLGNPPIAGDINSDGVIDAKDVKIALRLAGGLQDAATPDVSFSNGDENGDGRVDMVDALRIGRLIGR
jgi:hypothetical protein